MYLSFQDLYERCQNLSSDDYKAINYTKLVPLMIESIKTLKAEIEDLKK